MPVSQIGSFIDIEITRNIPIINRALSLPPNKEKQRNSVAASTVVQSLPSGTRIVRLGGGSGGASTAGWRYGKQEFLQLTPTSSQESTDQVYQEMVALQE